MFSALSWMTWGNIKVHAICINGFKLHCKTVKSCGKSNIELMESDVHKCLVFILLRMMFENVFWVWVCLANSTFMTTMLHKCKCNETQSPKKFILSYCISNSPWYHGQLPHLHRHQTKFSTLVSSPNIEHTRWPALYYCSSAPNQPMFSTFLHRVLKCHPLLNPPVTVLRNTHQFTLSHSALFSLREELLF